MNYSNVNIPQVLKNFLSNMETIKGKSPSTVDEYYLDMRTFFRFIKIKNGLSPANTPIEDINIEDIDLDIIKKIGLSDIYDYMIFLSREKSNSAKTRARKLSCLRSFFRYLQKNGDIKENPVKDIDSPKTKQSLPRYLSLEESLELLNNIDGEFKERNYAIITLFLNCGLRLSELVGINLNDIKDDNTLVVLGKGNKERVVYLNPSCVEAVNAYKKVRPNSLKEKNALFISRQNQRISVKTVQWVVKTSLKKAGLDSMEYSVHKLRHTAATLMYRNGVDIRVLQEILGHANLGTTQIYTHVGSEQIEEAAMLNPLAKVRQKRKQNDRE